MDEFTSIMAWLFIVFVTIGIATTWVSSNSQVMRINGVDTNALAMITSSKSSVETTYNTSNQNWVVSTLQTAIGTANQLWAGLTAFFGILFNVFTGWHSLLVAIFSPIPGGQLFIDILTPLFFVAEISAIFIVLLRVFLVLRGLVSL